MTARPERGRDRDLIARSAALLCDDLPLATLVERLREAVAEAFEGEAFVVLRGGPPAPELHAGAAGEALGGAASRTDSVLFVPIGGGNESLGALGVARNAGPPFTPDDQRLLEALARYLGIAVLNQRTFRIDALAMRHPWLPIVLACVVAIAASAALFFYAREQVAETRDTAASLQAGRLRQSALMLEDYLGDSVHLADAIANVVGPMHASQRVVENVLARFFLSIDDPAIFGLGVDFEPYQFDPRLRLYSLYVERSTTKPGRYESYGTNQSYDYLNLSWYRLGRRTGGHIGFTRPYYEDSRTYISAIRPIYRSGKFAGVVTVDSLPKQVVGLLRSALHAGDVAYVTDASGAIVVATGAMPSPSPARRTIAMSLRWAPWTIHLSSDFAAADARVRSIVSSSLLFVAAIWLTTLLAIVLLVRARRAHVTALGFQFRHADLENEIATSLAVAESLRESAYHDSLTGLPNRTFFLDALRQRTGDLPPDGAFAVLFIDIDRFSVVNDSLGHGAGDALLRQIAERLLDALPPETTLARLGGDEFVALLDAEPGDAAAAVACAKQILVRMREPFVLRETELYSGASIGIVLNASRETAAEALLRDADIAMYEAKRTGRGRYTIFDEAMHARVRALLETGSELRRAVARGAVIPYFQPIVEIRSGRMASMEALARWERPDGTVTGAADFIDAAEQSGALAAIDAIVLLSACRATAALAQEFGRTLQVAVNVSAAQLTRTDIVADIVAALESSGLASGSLKLEITETAIMENAEEALLVLNRLRALKLGIVVDDFGTGYSSLSYLRRLPISGLKIDRSFVSPMTTDPQALAIVRAVVALAKTLGLEVTAEGVETAEQRALLVECGVDYGQGYYFCKAVPAAALRELVAADSALGSTA